MGLFWGKVNTPAVFFITSEDENLYRRAGGAPGYAAKSDSGTDLRFPTETVIEPSNTRNGLPTIVDMQVKIRCRRDGKFVAFFVVPRSSIAKTPLSFANSIGVIDSGYQGNIRLALHNHSDTTFVIGKGFSLAQIVTHDLSPAQVDVVSNDHFAFYYTTSRADGGFGSTGKHGRL